MKHFLLLLALLFAITTPFQIQLHHPASHEDRLYALRRLQQIQNNVFFPSFRKRDSIELKSFKEDQDRRILAYYGIITIGTHRYNMLFDSGSTNVFVMSTLCHDESCRGHSLYDSSKAKRQVESYNIIQYICGKSVGMLVLDDVSFGPGKLRISDQHIHVGNTVEIPAFVNSKWDGIMGLGYYPLQADTLPEQKQELAGVSGFKLSIVDNILIQNALPQDQMFFMYSLNKQGGLITFGELPPHVSPQSITWVNVDKSQVNEEVSWILKLVDVKLVYPKNVSRPVREEEGRQRHREVEQQQESNQELVDEFSRFMRLNKRGRFRLKKMLSHYDLSHEKTDKADKSFRRSLCSKGCKLLIDTGTYLNYIPTLMFKQLMGKLDFRSNVCQDMERLPDVVFVFDDHQQIILRPSHYLEVYGKGVSKVCTNSFTPDTIENDIITLGQMFLKTFHTVFDFGNKRIGFSSNVSG